ncbi:MAG: phenylalanine--tRNA ligase subunit beta [Chloroflexi bacterium]|nr:phenylalanine--tRNA ligase subunit beta [Chloroflexota bacterium]
MKLPISWIKEYVDIDLSTNQLAQLLTMLGLEVEEVRLVGLPMPQGERLATRFSGLGWDPEKIIVGRIDEVMPHPNADRLVLCRLFDGDKEQIVLTGAPNLYEYKGKGPLAKPLKVAYATEGSQIYDGHQPGFHLVTLKRARIRGVESYSMACSEKELGISDQHEGIIILDDDAPAGMPLVDYMGDAVFEIKINPNMIRNACVVGVAREIAAATGKTLRKPQLTQPVNGSSIAGKVNIQISDPELNSRFAVGMINGVEARPSPYKVQLRLTLAGMRPINSIVDATNYVMLELGEPLHAFDYDTLVKRTGGKAPTIITRAAHPNERLTTLDNNDRKLDDFTILVTDTAGPLSLAGVMGGLESEVIPQTTNILLEGAAWNFINIRKTVKSQKLPSEAAYRFERGIHPALCIQAVQLGLERMAAWSGGRIATGFVDAYPRVYQDPIVAVTTADVLRHLGIKLTGQEIADILSRLEFECRVDGDTVYAKSPAFRIDIGEGLIGLADVMEEIARIYGYENIPGKQLDDALPYQKNDPALEKEDRLKDLLVDLGLQEVITYRMTTPEREARILPTGTEMLQQDYVRLENPISQDRTVLRRSLLVSVLEILERNSRLRDRLAFFEIGPVFWPRAGEKLPQEEPFLVIAMTGVTDESTWDRPAGAELDFYDLKGVIEAMLEGLHIHSKSIHIEEGEAQPHPSFQPGKYASLLLNGEKAGVFGIIHPLVKEKFDFDKPVVLAAEFRLNVLLEATPWQYDVNPVPVYPAVHEDIAIIVDETISNGQIEQIIYETGGEMLAGVRLFDIFRGGQIGEGKKSLAYSLTYISHARTLTDKDAAKIRNKIVGRLEHELGAVLRSS